MRGAMRGNIGICELSRVLVAQDERGWRVVVDLWVDLEEPQARVTHYALFASRQDAHRLAARVDARRVLDLRWWTWTPERVQAVEAFSAPPVARLETRPRSGSQGHDGHEAIRYTVAA